MYTYVYIYIIIHHVYGQIWVNKVIPSPIIYHDDLFGGCSSAQQVYDFLEWCLDFISCLPTDPYLYKWNCETLFPQHFAYWAIFSWPKDAS